jgi:hypothetical protein
MCARFGIASEKSMGIDGSGLSAMWTRGELRQVPLLIKIPPTPNKS